MGITYYPAGFKHFIGTYLERRLESREGVAFIGESVADLKNSNWIIEGRLLEVCNDAGKFSELNPQMNVFVLEKNCGDTDPMMGKHNSSRERM